MPLVRTRAVRVLSLIALLALPATSEANAGIPMLALTWPLAWILFLPIVALEAWVAVKTLLVPWGRAVTLSLSANAASTVVGIPITWFLLFLLEMAVLIPLGQFTQAAPSWLEVTVGAPWIAPPENDSTWRIAIATIWLCLFFAAASVLIEKRVVRWLAPDLQAPAVHRWAIVANVLTYVVFLAVVLVWWVWPEG